MSAASAINYCFIIQAVLLFTPRRRLNSSVEVPVLDRQIRSIAKNQMERGQLRAAKQGACCQKTRLLQ